MIHEITGNNMKRKLRPLTSDFRLLVSAAADEMNNLNPIAFAQNRVGPIRAPHNVAIQLDRHARRLELERRHQSCDGQIICKLARLAV